MSDLSVFLSDPPFGIFFTSTITRAEHSGCYVVLQELLVDHVDNSRNYSFDILLSFTQCDNVICKSHGKSLPYQINAS